MATKFTHNDLNMGDRIQINGIESDCILVAILDGNRGLKVCPIEGANEVSWIDISDVAGCIRDYRPSGLLFPSFMEAGAFLASKGYEPSSEGYVREVGRYRYHASQVYQGDSKCVHLSFATPELMPAKG